MFTRKNFVFLYLFDPSNESFLNSALTGSRVGFKPRLLPKATGKLAGSMAAENLAPSVMVWKPRKKIGETNV